MPKYTYSFSISSYSKLFLSFWASSLPYVWANPNCQLSGVCRLSELTDGIGGFVLEGEATDDGSGRSVSEAGDVNGDGLGDFLIGAYGAAPNGQIDAGKTYVVFGSNSSSAWGNGTLALSDFIDGERGFVLEGETAGDWSGYSVSAAGDMNRDGLGDVAIGAYRASRAGRAGVGKAYVVFGNDHPSAWGNGTLSLSEIVDGVRGFALQGEEVGDGFGISISAAGDVNGDGLGDLLIGAHRADTWTRHQNVDAGKTYVVFGSHHSMAWGNGTLNSKEFIDGRRGFVIEGNGFGAYSGISVSGLADINLDGVDDILIRAPSTGAQYAGVSPRPFTYIVFGRNHSMAWGNHSAYVMDDLINRGVGGFFIQGGGWADSTVSMVGDVNGDGVGDLLIGAPQEYARHSHSHEGKTYVIFGFNTSSSSKIDWLNLNNLVDGIRGFALGGEADGDCSGFSVSSAGDINKDGIGDLLIGAYKANIDGLNNVGKTYVVFGSDKTTAWGDRTLILNEIMDGRRGFVLEGDLYGEHSGCSVSKATDINGDGFGDLLIGAYMASPGGRAHAGKTYVIFGSNLSFPPVVSPSPSLPSSTSKSPRMAISQFKISHSPFPEFLSSRSLSPSVWYSVSSTPNADKSFSTIMSVHAILLLTIGVIASGLLGLYAWLEYQSRRRIELAIQSHRIGLLKQNQHYQQNTLRPISKAVLQRLNIRGCGVQSLQKSHEYLDAINLLINAMNLQEIQTDLSKLTQAQRQRFLAKITDAIHVELIGSKRCDNPVWCASLFKANVTPRRLQDAAENIALRLKNSLSQEELIHPSAVQMSMFHQAPAMTLHQAVSRRVNQFEIEALLTKNPDELYRKDEQGKWPVEIAAEAGFVELVELLFTKGSPGDQVAIIQQALESQTVIEHKTSNRFST